MANIKLFRILKNKAQELQPHRPVLEKKLQNLIESNLEEFLGIKLIASEFSTGKEHGGRIDTLGIDENDCPVILEYKLSANENIINQGLFYMNWLLNHKKDFEFLIMEKCGKEKYKDIDWAATRLLCVAADFTRYDEHAVKQIAHNIELIRYRYFSEDLFLLELVNTASPYPSNAAERHSKDIGSSLTAPNQYLLELYNELKAYVFSLGDDIELKHLKHYYAFRRLRNFLCICTRSQKLVLYLNIDPKSLTLEEGFTRDVTNIGHYPTGNLQVTVTSAHDLNKAKVLIQRSYDGS